MLVRVQPVLTDVMLYPNISKIHFVKLEAGAFEKGFRFT